MKTVKIPACVVKHASEISCNNMDTVAKQDSNKIRSIPTRIPHTRIGPFVQAVCTVSSHLLTDGNAKDGYFYFLSKWQ